VMSPDSQPKNLSPRKHRWWFTAFLRTVDSDCVVEMRGGRALEMISQEMEVDQRFRR